MEPFYLFCLVAAAPVLVTTLPPMVDLPQHAAQVALLNDLAAGGSPFASLFEVQAFTPYWFGYSLLFVLAKAFGVARASKVLVALAVVAFAAAATRFASRHAVAPHWRWLFLPLPFGFAYEWGFLNFLVAVPLGYLFLAALDLEERPPSRRQVLLLALGAHALFFAHVLVMAYFVAVAALMLHVPRPREWLVRVAPLASVGPVVVLWVLGKRASSGEVRVPPLFSWGWWRLESLPSTLFSLRLGDDTLAVALLLIAAPFFAGYRLRRELRAWGPLLVHVLVMLFGPRIAFGTSFVYERFGYVGLPLVAFAFERAPAPSRTAWAHRLLSPVYATVAAVMLFVHVQRARAYEAESEAFREVVAHAKPGRRLLGLPFLRSGVSYPAPTYLHYATWYSSLQGGLAEFSFATYFPQVVRYRKGAAPPSTDLVNWAPELFTWSEWKHVGYTYFLVRQAHDVQSELFPPGAVHLVAARGGWWLFEVNEGVQ